MAYTYIVGNFTSDVTYDKHQYVYGESAFNAFWSMGSEDANSTGKSFSGNYGLVAPKWSFYGNWEITNEVFVEDPAEEPRPDPTYEATEITASGAFTNNGILNFVGDGTKSLSFTAASFTNKGSVSLKNATFTATSFVDNGNGSFTASGANTIKGAFTGGTINLSGTLNATSSITGSAAIVVDKKLTLANGVTLATATDPDQNQQDFTVNNAASIYTTAGDATNTISGDFTFTKTTATGYILAYGTNVFTIGSITGRGMVAVQENATLKNSEVGGTVAFGKNAKLLGNNMITTIQVKKNNKNAEGADQGAPEFGDDNYRKLTIGDGGTTVTEVTANTIQIGSTPATEYGNLDINNATVTVQTAANSGAFNTATDCVTTVANSTVIADNVTVAAAGSFTVSGASTLKIGKMVEPEGEGDAELVGGLSGTITVGAATTLAGASIYEAADKTATVVISDETKTDAKKVTLSGTNTITADIVNNGQLVVNGTLNAANIDSNYVLSFSGATVEAGTIKNASSANVTTIVNSNVTADEIDASIGTFIVKGSSGSTLKVGSATKGGLSGKITMQGASAPSVIKDSAIYKKTGAEVSQVELINNGENGVSFSGTNSIAADIVNNATTAVAGNFSAGKITKQTGTGAYEGASITAANGAVLNISDLQTTILVESTLGASTISSKAENGANLSATGAMTLAGNVAVSNITVTAADAITLNKDVVLTIDTASKIEATAGALSVQVIDEKKQTASIVVDGSDLTYASTIGSKPLVVTATGIDDNISYNFMNGTKTLVVTDTEDPEKTKTFSLAKFGNGIYLLENQTQETLYVNAAYASTATGDTTSDGHIKGYNAFSSVPEFTQIRAANLKAQFPATDKIEFLGASNYEAKSNYGYYTDGNVTLTVATNGDDEAKNTARIVTGERFYLMHALEYVKVGDNTYKLMDGNVEVTEAYQAPIFTLEEGKTLAIVKDGNPQVDGLLMIGDTLDLPEFEENPQTRTAGVAELDVNGTLNANVKLAPYSTVKISSTGKVQATSALNIGSYLRQHSLIQVDGVPENSTGRNTKTQFDVSYLTYINGGDLVLNNTNSQIRHIRFCDSGDISLLPSTDATITLDNTALVSNGTATDSYGEKALSTFFLFDSTETVYIAPALPFSKNVLVSLTNNSSITAANLDFNPNALTTVNVGLADTTKDSGANTLTAKTITNSGTINVRNGSTVSTSDTGYWAFDNNKTLLVDGAGSKILGTVSNGHVAAGTATVSNSASIGTADNLSKYVINYAGSTFDVTTGATINASELQNGGVFTIDGANLNVGKLTHRKDQGGSFTVKGESTLKIGNLVEGTDMYGPINVADGAVLSATSIEGKGTVVFDAATTGTNQGITLSGNNTITAAIKNNGTITGNGALTAGAITNEGKITVTDKLTAGAITNTVTGASISAASIDAGAITNTQKITTTGNLKAAGIYNSEDNGDISATGTGATITSTDNISNTGKGKISAANLVLEGEDKSITNGTDDDHNAEILISTKISGASSSTITNYGKIGKDTAIVGTIDVGSVTNNENGTIYAGSIKAASITNVSGSSATVAWTKIVATDITATGETGITNNGGTIEATTISGKITNGTNIPASEIKAKTITATTGVIMNAGTIKVTGGEGADNAGSFNVGSGADNTNGTIELNNAVLSGGGISKGTINAKNGSVITTTTDYSSISLTGSTVAAAHVDASGAQFTVEASDTASEIAINEFIGTIELENGAKLQNSDVTRYNGISYAAAVTIAAGAAVEFVGTNAFTKNANAPADAKFNFTNSGALTIDADVAKCLTVAGDFTNNNSITIDASTLTLGNTPVQIVSAGTFTNNGTISVTGIDEETAKLVNIIVKNDATAASGENGIYLYKTDKEIDMSTIVVNQSWTDKNIGDPVAFGKGMYVFGSNAFLNANEIINLTEKTKNIQFARSGVSYGNLTLHYDTDLSVWSTDGLVPGGSIELGNLTIGNEGDEVKDIRVNIGETNPPATIGLTIGALTITNADVDFDNVNTTITGNVSITGANSEVEFDRGATVGGVFELGAGSKVEADQGYTFALASGVTNEINGKLLVTSKDAEANLATTATLNTISGSGTIYTDVKSTLSFDGSFSGIVNVDVTGLEWTGPATAVSFAIASTNTTKPTIKVTGVADPDNYQKYFNVYEGNSLVQRDLACNVINVAKDADADTVLTAVTHKWTVTGLGEFYADNVVLNGTTETVYLQGNSADQMIKLNSGSYKAVYGGKNVVINTDPANLGGDINLTINDGTYSQVVVGGDRIKVTDVTTGRPQYYRDGDIKLTINGGHFNNFVATGMLYQGDYVKGSAEVDNTYLVINGGTFEKHVYGGNYATSLAGSKKTTIYGSSNVELNAVKNDITIKGTLFVGSIGNGEIYEGTNLTLTGSKTITTGDIWGGSSEDKVFIEDDGTRTFIGGVEGERTLTFTGFTGTLATKNIHGFSVAVIENGTQTMLQDTVTLVDVNEWEIEAGSTLNGAFQNDFKGDSLALTGLDGYDLTNDWVLFGDTTYFTNFDGFKSVDFGGTAEVKFDGTSWSDGTYALSINENKQMVLGLA